MQCTPEGRTRVCVCVSVLSRWGGKMGVVVQGSIYNMYTIWVALEEREQQ